MFLQRFSPIPSPQQTRFLPLCQENGAGASDCLTSLSSKRDRFCLVLWISRIVGGMLVYKQVVPPFERHTLCTRRAKGAAA
jgi:hypothetical protein